MLERENFGARTLGCRTIPSLLALLLSVSLACALAGDTSADRLLGQVDFRHNGPNMVSASGLFGPTGAAIDASVTPNRVYIADASNNRVLGWADAAAFANGAPADLVIGQPDFLSSACSQTVSASTLCFPTGAAVDAAGNLYVADQNNSRVLEYNTPFATDTVADLVFGQGGSLTSNNCNRAGLNAGSLCFPSGVALDRVGNLYVADQINSRVLEYNAPLASDTIADLVIGQSDLVSSSCVATTSGLCFPTGVAVDSAGNLYVADQSNSRVLEYSAPLTTGMVANIVFGQGGSFTLAGCDDVALSVGLCSPTGVAVDSAGNLYVADSSNSRVLEYKTPLTTDTTPDIVFGQGGSFASSICNSGGVGADSLCLPAGVAVDGAGNLYVVDQGNNRALKYDAPLTTGIVADHVLGQADFAHNGPNIVAAPDLYGPGGVAIDASVTPNRFYVADSSNNRVLGWADAAAFANGAPADLVIGQPDFLSSRCNQTVGASTLCLPTGVAVDVAGNLYVADQNNSRVLEYNSPFTTDTSADMAFGQGGSFTSGNCNQGGLSAKSLCLPSAVAVDSSGNLYVSDFNNSRVLRYNTPLTTDAVADIVLGQGGSFISNNCNGAGLNAGSLCFPTGVAVDSVGNLYVADQTNSRVLEYNAPFANDATAARVFGQGGAFTSGGCNHGGISAAALCFPAGVAVDAPGNLYVADQNNSRVLEFNTPLATDTIADLVFGQLGSFTSRVCNKGGVSADSLCSPSGVAVDSNGNLYVADQGNNRALEYDAPLELATPKPTQTSVPAPTATPTATPSPTPTASPTLMPTPTLTGTPTPSPTLTATPSPTAVPPTPTASRTPVPSPTPTPTATGTATPTPTATPTQTPTPVATETPPPSPTPTAIPPAPTATAPGGPSPTLDPTATPTPFPGGQLDIDPERVDFGEVGPGDTRTRAVRVRNHSPNGTSVRIVAAAIVPAGSPFVIASDSCSGTILALHDRCVIRLSFKPAAEGPDTATLIISAGAGQYGVALRGSGRKRNHHFGRDADRLGVTRTLDK